jgi:hypothetical protein
MAMKLRKRRQGLENDNDDKVSPVEQENGYMTPHVYEAGPVEMLAESAPVEVVGTRLVAELPGSHGIKVKSPS